MLQISIYVLLYDLHIRRRGLNNAQIATTVGFIQIHVFGQYGF